MEAVEGVEDLDRASSTKTAGIHILASGRILCLSESLERASGGDAQAAEGCHAGLLAP